jgi:predicted MFS family arabinose efflux permease
MARVSSLSHVGGLERYAALFRAPSVRSVVSAGLLGRLPLGMLPLGNVLLIRHAGESYAVVGVVVAAVSIANGISSPLIGRLIDRAGLTRVLLPLAVLFPISIIVLVALADRHAAPLVLAASAAASGVTLPPLGACVRSLWPTMLPSPDLKETAFALEASMQEVSFVLGPVLVGAIAATTSPAIGMLTAGALSCVGTIWFALTRPAQAASRNVHEGPRSRRGALASHGVRTVILACIALGIAFGAVEVTMPAFAEVHATRAEGSLILTCFALGSLIGGFWAGTRAAPLRPELRFAGMLALLGCALIPPLVAPSLLVMCAIMIVAGMPIAPAVGASYGLVDRLAVAGTSTEAFAWLTTAIVAGMSIGTAVSGVLVAHGGPTWALAIAGPGPLVAALVVFARRGSLTPTPSRS